MPGVLLDALTGLFASRAWGSPTDGLLLGNPRQLGVQVLAVDRPVDEAAAHLRTEIDSKPQQLDEVDRQIMQLEIERQALSKEKDKSALERLEALNAELTELREKSAGMKQINREATTMIQSMSSRCTVRYLRYGVIRQKDRFTRWLKKDIEKPRYSQGNGLLPPRFCLPSLCLRKRGVRES